MMKKFCYRWMMILLALTACSRVEEPDMPQPAPEGERVQLTFQVAVPTDEVSTKAMGLTPTIDPNGFYIAVFGGSGFFNEWVKATVVSATANYDPDNTSGANGANATVYTITASLTVSDSRLRLHFIANCPTSVRTSPPISGSADTEEYVMSRIRSQKSETYNDGYWAKVILPHGVRANGVPTGNGNQINYVPTQETLAQFPSPIVMVRNFARVYLRNLTPTYTVNGQSHRLVTIKKYALAYAPSEGVIAPILATPYMSDENGDYLAEEPATGKIYYEGFYKDYINGTLATNMLTHGIFSYTGTAPANQKYDYYPNNDPVGVPVASDFIDWHENEAENILYVYERSIPSTERRATRIIILAERVDENNHSEGDKYYALDIVNPDGVTIPLLRNQSYTVLLKNIEAGSGESDIANAARANSATVSGDPEYQSLTNISDGQSSIATSFTEMFYVKPQKDSVMFRYIPTSAGDDTYAAGAVGNDEVTVSVGTVNMETGVFTAQTPAAATSAGVLTFDTDANGYKVWIDKENSKAVSYVRYNNAWVKFDAGNAAHANLEKWGKIYYILHQGNVDSDGYYTQERSQAIHVNGRYNNKDMSRNVIIKLSPRQTMSVSCLQKYVLAAAGQREVVRVYIPTGLSRSVFPLEFKIEPNGYSLTPDGDVLPVTSGVSIDPNNSGPAYFFIKELTQNAYNALPTRQIGSTTWKYFDCVFKTTLPQNACTVYVANKYFNDDNAHDSFSNYYQRLFSSLTLPSTVSYGQTVTFSFVMDAEHSSAANTVFWDPVNALEASVSNANRVLPKMMRVELQGLTLKYKDDGVTPWDGDDTARLSHESGNTYTYYVSNVDNVNPTFSLIVNGNVGTEAKVTLSTANLSDNPNLYASNSTSKTIVGATFSAAEFTSASQFYETGQTVYLRFVYASGLIEPATLTLTGLEYVGSDARISGSNGTYTFTPTAVDISNNILEYTLPFRTTGPNGGVSAVLAAEGYVSRTVSHTALTGLTLDKTTVRLASNVAALKTVTLTPTFTPAGLTPTPAVVWTSSNTAVATVENGVVTAVSNGTATITASAGSFTATCTVTVKKRVWTTGTYSWTATNGNKNTSSFTDNTSGISITFANYSGKNGYKEMSVYDWGAKNGTIAISAVNSSLEGCVLTGASISYNDGYNDQNVTASPGTISNNKQTWTASSSGEGNGDTSVTITMSYAALYKNRVSGLSISYGYYTWED